MSFASAKHEPPLYLLTQPLASSSAQSAANFAHPVIEYQFGDDPPSNLLPKSDAETVVIVDYENNDAAPVARSLNRELAVAGVKVTPAPGVGAAGEGETRRNDTMYIIETLAAECTGETMAEHEDTQQLLAQFRERNALLKRILDQPSLKPSNSQPEDTEPALSNVP
ncbi:hypothetical protein ACEPAF_3441 [Sanghuangporus sanghuang]|uniref:Uncharacterized protein n=1 Tax=Sanghuangporus baumii TaxID=108892 RepID=A0A9Q5HUF2_SANBA|nr:hypothetical protein A7U60_g6692 [Sanghuangporus baumii]